MGQPPGRECAADHINKMIAQALRDDKDKKLLVVARCMKNDDVEKKRSDVAEKLGVGHSQVVPLKGTTKSFLSHPNPAEILFEHMPKAADSPF